MLVGAIRLVSLFLPFVVVLSAAVAVAAAAEEEAEEARVTDLKVDTLFRPEECEREARNGDLLSIHYTGTLLKDGSVFDSSHDRKEPFVFQLGRKQVIRGWEFGLDGICKGEKRLLTIPPHLAYGEMETDKIPAHSHLVFEVECVDIQAGPGAINVFKAIDNDEDGQLSREEVAEYLRQQIPKDMHEEDIAQFDEDKMVEEIFQHEDRDKNGFISHKEFNGPKHDEL